MSFSWTVRDPVRQCRDACELAVGHGTPRRAAKLAAVVGTLLVLINQWEAVVGTASMDWVKVTLTYCRSAAGVGVLLITVILLQHRHTGSTR